MRHAYPRTIENGAGEILTFQQVVPTLRGDRLEAEGGAEPGSGPPLHIHYLQEEGFEVISGRMAYQLGEHGPAQYLEPGQKAVFPPGIPHTWWNAGQDRLHMKAWMMPADNAEYFLAAQFESMKRNGGKRPGLFDSAFLLTRYRSEFGILQIPKVVQAIVFPVLVAIGRLLGKYGRYADAPEPVEAR